MVPSEKSLDSKRNSLNKVNIMVKFDSEDFDREYPNKSHYNWFARI